MIHCFLVTKLESVPISSLLNLVKKASLFSDRNLLAMDLCLVSKSLKTCNASDSLSKPDKLAKEISRSQ